MIRLQVSLFRPGCAQGKYIVRAKGFILAVLRWGNAEGPLAGWGPFAYVPVDPAGNGIFTFAGRRGIPAGATHVWAQCHRADFTSCEDVCVEIPPKYRAVTGGAETAYRFSVLTDLHLSSKPWKIRQALSATESDTVLLLGDSTNDGLKKQFDAFRACIETVAPEKAFFPVIGNHDVLPASEENEPDGQRNYMAFQKDLLAKAEKIGYSVSYDPESPAYAVRIGDLDLIGLQCATTGRRFRFPEGRQIDWLEDHLNSSPALRYIILCHAPLLAHNPARNQGTPYLHENRRIQEIADRKGHILFLSGHTHVSPNSTAGNAEYDGEHRNLYLDCSSVVPTDTSGIEGLMSPDWNEGVKTELTVSADSIEICMSSIGSGVRFPRGYYQFSGMQETKAE